MIYNLALAPKYVKVSEFFPAFWITVKNCFTFYTHQALALSATCPSHSQAASINIVDSSKPAIAALYSSSGFAESETSVDLYITKKNNEFNTMLCWTLPGGWGINLISGFVIRSAVSHHFSTLATKKTRAVGGWRNPSAYVVVGTPYFSTFFRKNF